MWQVCRRRKIKQRGGGQKEGEGRLRYWRVEWGGLRWSERRGVQSLKEDREQMSGRWRTREEVLAFIIKSTQPARGRLNSLLSGQCFLPLFQQRN